MHSTLDLFSGYLKTLEGRSSHQNAGRILLPAGEAIAKPARDVTPQDVVAVLRPIYARGSRAQADKARMFMRAAFEWAMKAGNDYRVLDAKDWGLVRNPAAAIPRDPESQKPGQRWLRPSEFMDMLRWARRCSTRDAIRCIMLTGQRVTEIQHMRVDQWDSAERVVSWQTTKNGLPHCIPVVDEVADILDWRAVPGQEFMFPARRRSGAPVPTVTTKHAIYRYCAAHGVPHLTSRDLRRTFKTLAGEAGLTIAERDSLQNHRPGTVSERNYNRYNELREKRAAVQRWQAWLSQDKPARKPADCAANQVVDGQQ